MYNSVEKLQKGEIGREGCGDDDVQFSLLLVCVCGAQKKNKLVEETFVFRR